MTKSSPTLPNSTTAGVPGGMMGAGGVVSMRRNDDYTSDYAFDFSDDAPGHPDISDYVLDSRDYRDYSSSDDINHQPHLARHFSHYSDLSDYQDYQDHGFEYETGFDYY